MNKQPIVTSGERNISPFLAACAGIHLAGDFLLMRKAWFLEFNELLIAMALPLSQCSLIAIWAASSERCWCCGLPSLRWSRCSAGMC